METIKIPWHNWVFHRVAQFYCFCVGNIMLSKNTGLWEHVAVITWKFGVRRFLKFPLPQYWKNLGPKGEFFVCRWIWIFKWTSTGNHLNNYTIYGADLLGFELIQLRARGKAWENWSEISFSLNVLPSRRNFQGKQSLLFPLPAAHVCQLSQQQQQPRNFW